MSDFAFNLLEQVRLVFEKTAVTFVLLLEGLH